MNHTTFRLFRVKAAIASIAFTVGSAWASSISAPSTVTDYSPVAADLEKHISEYMEQKKIPGLQIALIDGHRTVWSKGFGYTDNSKQVSISNRTLFSLQSISKTYTTIGVLRAVQKGLLSLDDPVRKYLPELAVKSRSGDDEAGKITVRHLLSHRSGLGHEAPVGGNYYEAPASFAEHIQSIRWMWLHFPVGAQYSYSNVGIDLAGRILEVVSQKSFAQYMTDEVFLPLGMLLSTMDQQQAFHMQFAHGHDDGRQIPDLQIVITPSGGMYSNASDMARFVAMELAGGNSTGTRYLEGDLIAEMSKLQFAVDSQTEGYGLGLVSDRWLGARRLNHGGGGYGYSTVQIWSPEYQVGAVVLTNQSGNMAIPLAESAMRMMVRLKRGGLPKPRPVPALTQLPPMRIAAAQLDRLAGHYIAQPFGIMVSFTADNGVLKLIDGSSNPDLMAHSDIQFTSDMQRFDFKLDANDNPSGVQVMTKCCWDAWGCCWSAYWPRIGSLADPPGPSKPEWEKYVGKYRGRKYGEDVFQSVSIRNGHLHVDWNGWQTLEEYEPGLFFTPAGEPVLLDGARLIFGNRPFVKME